MQCFYKLGILSKGLVNTVDYMTCIRDLKGNFARINDSFEQILRYTSEELFGHPYVNQIHPV
ncbi:MAG: PAS domain-containing protein [Planctomycetota bacterium]